MSTDFAPLFEKKFHDKVVPGLLHLMDDNANPRVQAHAGAALGMVSNNNYNFWSQYFPDLHFWTSHFLFTSQIQGVRA